MGRPESSPPRPGPVICTCFGFTAADLGDIIRDRRCRSVEDVAEATGACRGCQTCRPDIEALLAAGDSPRA